MRISNNFKKLWIDRKGQIEGYIEVKVIKISNNTVSLAIRLTDDEDDKLIKWGPNVLTEGDTVTLSNIKISVDIKIKEC